MKRKGGKGSRRHSFPMGVYSSDRGGQDGQRGYVLLYSAYSAETGTVSEDGERNRTGEK